MHWMTSLCTLAGQRRRTTAATDGGSDGRRADAAGKTPHAGAERGQQGARGGPPRRQSRRRSEVVLWPLHAARVGNRRRGGGRTRPKRTQSWTGKDRNRRNRAPATEQDEDSVWRRPNDTATGLSGAALGTSQRRRTRRRAVSRADEANRPAGRLKRTGHGGVAAVQHAESLYGQRRGGRAYSTYR